MGGGGENFSFKNTISTLNLNVNILVTDLLIALNVCDIFISVTSDFQGKYQDLVF